MKTKIIFMSIFLVMMGVVNAAPPVTGNLVMHLDASEIVAADGSAVATWSDQSGSGNDATQTTSTAQPTYVASNEAFNGLATVSFDGTDDWMDLNESAVDIGNFTIFVVGKFDRPDGANMYFMSAQASGGDDRLRIASYNNNIQSRIGNVGDFTIISGRVTDTHVYALTSAPNAWADGAGPISGGNNTFSGSPDNNGFVLGAYGPGTKDFLQGSISEVILYNTVLSDTDIDLVNAYLITKMDTKAHTPDPEIAETLVEVDLLGRDVPGELSWSAPSAYIDATYNVYFGTTEPNTLVANYGLTQIGTAGQSATSAAPTAFLPLDYGTPYYWVVDTYEPNDVAPFTPILHQGEAWSFTTAPSDNIPVVTAGSDWLTWLDSGSATQAVSGTIDDFGEGDIADADIVWTIQAYPGGRPFTCMQMIDRGGNDPLPASETDDALLRDWIGTDTRGDNIAGDPMTLTISGLASGTYTLTTIHHDLEDQTGKFDIAIDGSPVATDVDITSGTESPITRHVETIISDGLNPIEVVFDVNETLVSDSNSFFVMNGLEIEDASSNVVKIDFGNNAANTSSEYEGYIAVHESANTFGPAYYALGTGYVSISPIWGQVSTFASVTKTNTGLSSTADFTTTQTGTYALRLTATDDTTGGNPIPQVDWDVLTVQVVDDACAAAQLDTATWTGFMNGDINEDCNVDLQDLADLATEWLLKNEASGPIEL